jgi:type II secretory pathway pseudopilin PulG
LGRPAIIEKEYDTTVVRQPRGMSNATVAAIVISLITAAVLITFMIMSANQQSREADLAHQRDQAESNARAAQSNQQPAPVVVMPQQQQPVTVPVPVPVPTPAPSTSQMPPAANESAVSDTSLEVEINSRLLDDEELRPHPITIRYAAGTATLSGELPSEDLKTRAAKIARTIKEVRHVVNNITVVE